MKKLDAGLAHSVSSFHGIFQDHGNKVIDVSSSAHEITFSHNIAYYVKSQKSFLPLKKINNTL